MNQEARIQEFLKEMSQVTAKTGITYAVEAGHNFIIFDTQKNEPVELEITVGTEVVKNNGQTTITTFDRSNVNNTLAGKGDTDGKNQRKKEE